MSFQTDLFTKNHSQWVNAYNSPRSHKEFMELRALASPSFKGKLIVAVDQVISTNALSPTNLVSSIVPADFIVTKMYFAIRGAGKVDISCTGDLLLISSYVVDADQLSLSIEDVNSYIYSAYAVASGGTPSMTFLLWGYTPATD